MTFSLRLFGGISLESDGGALTAAASQRHRLALLALLAASNIRAFSREKLTALLWPENDAEHGRNLLNQSVYVLRKALGEGAVVSVGDELRLDFDIVRCDVNDFRTAIAAGDLERAVECYVGPFLDGFYLNDAREFEEWVSLKRARLASSYAGALENLAETAEARGELREAVARWRLLAAQDPYDSRSVLRLVRALAADGNPAGALRHVALHEQLLGEELGLPAPAEMRALAAQLRMDGHRTNVQHESGMGPGVYPSEEEPEGVEPHGERPGSGGPAKLFAVSKVEAGGRRRSTLLRAGAITFLLTASIFVGIRLGTESESPAPSEVVDTSLVTHEVAAAVARELERRALGTQPTRPEQQTRSIAAYELYLRGSEPAMLRSDSTVRKALEYFRRAVELDSTYAAAWAGVARTAFLVGGRPLGVEPDSTFWALSKWAAVRAVAVGDNVAETHATLALVRMLEFQFRSAEEGLKRAIELEPTRARFREWIVNLYLWTGRHEEALAEARRAIELDPLSPSANAELARVLLTVGRHEEALARLERLDRLEPPLLRVPTIAAQCYARRGSWKLAISTVRRSPGVDGPIVQGFLGYLLARAGKRNEALQIRRELLQRRQYQNAGAFPIALVSAGLGDSDQTLVWLEQAIDDRSLMGGPEHFTTTDPIFEQLREHPRFDRVRERLGLGVERS